MTGWSEREQLINQTLSVKMDHLKSKSLQNNAWIYQVQEASEGSDIVIFAKRFLGKHHSQKNFATCCVHHFPTVKASNLNSSNNALNEGFWETQKTSLLVSLSVFMAFFWRIMIIKIECRITSERDGLDKILLMYFAKALARPC